MFRHKKLIPITMLIVILFSSLWMVNRTNVQAASRPDEILSPTPTLTPINLLVGTFYISTSGKDSNNGSQSAPWRHIQYAVDRVGPGSTINVMTGVYKEKVTFHNSGSAGGGYITLRKAAGNKPVIDGAGLPISGETGLIVIENKAYIKVIGFEIRNLKAGGAPAALPAGIWIKGRGAFIEIRNNAVHDIANSCYDCRAHGIAVYGRDPNASIHDILIDGNKVYNCKLGWRESMSLNGNVEKFTVSNNIVHDNDNIGIDFIGFEGENPNPAVDRARNGRVFGNLVYNIDTYGNPAYGTDRSAGGIYVDGGTNIVIERNVIHHANLGIELGSEWAGKSTSYITVRNNFIYNNTQIGIAFGGYSKWRGRAENCVIVNNTLYKNFTEGDWGAELFVQFDTRYNTVKNNIIYANADRTFIESWSTVMTGNIVDYNLFFAPGGGTNGWWIWKNVPYKTFAAYRQATGNDAHGLAGVNPLFVSTMTPNLHLQFTSPGINRGQTLSAAGTLDIDGQARVQGVAIDLGADEVR